KFCPSEPRVLICAFGECAYLDAQLLVVVGNSWSRYTT
ncbi:MAG: hypothetical protein ACI9OF_002364, partial [Saprospiraceae bacterium]